MSSSFNKLLVLAVVAKLSYLKSDHRQLENTSKQVYDPQNQSYRVDIVALSKNYQEFYINNYGPFKAGGSENDFQIVDPESRLLWVARLDASGIVWTAADEATRSSVDVAQQSDDTNISVNYQYYKMY